MNGGGVDDEVCVLTCARVKIKVMSSNLHLHLDTKTLPIYIPRVVVIADGGRVRVARDSHGRHFLSSCVIMITH
jgi:hypothetical protein